MRGTLNRGAIVVALTVVGCTGRGEDSPPDVGVVAPDAAPPRLPTRAGPPADVAPYTVPALDKLVTKLGAKVVEVENPCVEREGERCLRQ